MTSLYRLSFGRKFRDKSLKFLTLMGTIAAITPLILVFSYVFSLGMKHVSWEFFSEVAAPMGSPTGGGLLHSMIGSVQVVFLSALMAAPFGILCGIYLAEFQHDKFTHSLRLVLDLLSSTPSIVVGLFANALLVLPMRSFSLLAGAAALAFLMLPVIARTSEEILKLNTREIREAGLALGLPRWKVIVFILVRGSRDGLLTSVMLAVARCAGETAPLLFTAFNSPYISKSIFQPTSTLPVQIYSYATSPSPIQQELAWTGALVLLMSVFATNLFARLVLARRSKGAMRS